MIPMADNMNHSDTNVIFEMITRSVHLDSDHTSTYFSRSKFMNDYGAIFNRDEHESKGEFDLINIHGRFNRENFNLNRKNESWETLRQEASTKLIWEVSFMWDRFFEDNDTESEEEGSDGEEEKASKHFKRLSEKKLSQNNGPLNFRKLREYIPLSEESNNVTSEETFSWYDCSKHEKESYFAMVNLNRRDLMPGEQAYYCYGNRSNRFLLINYGFCFKDNRYDSFELHLKTNVQSVLVPLMVQICPSSAQTQ